MYGTNHYTETLSHREYPFHVYDCSKWAGRVIVPERRPPGFRHAHPLRDSSAGHETNDLFGDLDGPDILHLAQSVDVW